MALSYEFSIGSVRAKETSLFTVTDIEQMLACKNLEELFGLLGDKGYGEGKSIDEIIENHMEDVWAYLKSVAPDFGIFAPFIIQNDTHNFKVVLKGTMANRSYEDLMLSPCTVSHKEMIEAVEHRKMYILPDWMVKPCEKTYDLLAHTGDSRAADAVLDKAAMLEMLKTSEGYTSEFLKQYFATLVFYNNIKIAIRASRTGTSKEYLTSALCEVKDFRMNAVIGAAVKGYDALIDELSKFSEYDCKSAMGQFKKSPSAFERFVDDKLIIMAKESCKRASDGAEPLLGYYLGVEAEKKVIHIIASGIKTNTDTDTIRERLREIYG